MFKLGSCRLFFLDAAKPEKLTDLSSQFQEMQVKISKLKEELDNAQRELKELKDKSDLGIEELRRELQQMRNSAQQGITVNNGTVQVTIFLLSVLNKVVN